MTRSPKLFARRHSWARGSQKRVSLRQAFVSTSRMLFWEAREVLQLLWFFAGPAICFLAFRQAEPMDRLLDTVGQTGQI